MNVTVQWWLHKLLPLYKKKNIISQLMRRSAVNIMKLLIPVMGLLLLVFTVLDQLWGLSHIEKLRFPNIPENVTVAIFRVKLALSGDPQTHGSCLFDKYHLSHPTAIPPHIWAVSSAVCYYDNKATQNWQMIFAR
jgi:hypothetical protein